jgi:hypothetical protein
MINSKSIGVFFLIVSLFSLQKSAPLQAQEQYQIPFHVQIQYFKKIFGYCLSLNNPSNPSIAIVCASKNDGDPIKSQFDKSGLTASEAVTVDEFVTGDKSYSVAYVCLGVKTDKLRSAFAKKKSLSITGESKFYDQGVVSAGLVLKDNKVKILFNMDRAKSEGHRFSAEFLRLTGFK